MAVRQWHQLLGEVLLDRLELLLHRRPPRLITLRLSVTGRLIGVRQMKLGEEPLGLVQ